MDNVPVPDLPSAELKPPIPRRPRGDPEPFPRADGRYQMWVELPRSAGQPRHRYPVYGSTKSACRDEYIKKRAELLFEIKPPDRHTTLAVALGRWLDERDPADEADRRIRRSSWRPEEQHVRLHVIPYLGAIPIGALATDEVEKWLRDLNRDGRSPIMRRKVLQTLRTAMNWAVRRGYIHDAKGSTVAHLAEMPIKPRQQAWVPITDDDQDHIVEVIKKHRLRALMLLAVTVGPRAGELAGLRRNADLDYKNHTFTINQTLTWHSGISGVAILEPTKTEAGQRTIALPDSLWAELMEHLDRVDAEAAAGNWRVADDVVYVREDDLSLTPVPTSDLVFPNSEGRPARTDGTGGIGSQWHTILKRAGVEQRRFHETRHIAASMLLRLNGGDLVEVAHILGHSTFRHTVDLYSHLSPDATRAVLERVTNARDLRAS